MGREGRARAFGGCALQLRIPSLGSDPARRPLRQAAGRHVLGDPSSRKDDAGGLPRPPGEAAGAEGPREVQRRGHHGDLKRIAAQTGTPWNKIVLKKGCSIVKDPVSLADCGIHDGRNLGL